MLVGSILDHVVWIVAFYLLLVMPGDLFVPTILEVLAVVYASATEEGYG